MLALLATLEPRALRHDRVPQYAQLADDFVVGCLDDAPKQPMFAGGLLVAVCEKLPDTTPRERDVNMGPDVCGWVPAQIMPIMPL